METVEQLRFLTPKQCLDVRGMVGTPAFVYDAATLQRQARLALQFPAAFGLTVRFAMKSNPNAAVLLLLGREGLHLDASSGYEVRRALTAGFAPDHISLSSQELPSFFPELARMGVRINLCSLDQLDRFGRAFPGARIGLRLNPGLGSGSCNRTNVAGPASSFGIWHGLMPRVQELVAQHKLTVIRIHTHVGSGSDPSVWQRVARISLALCERFPAVTTLNLGGGFKVARVPSEKSTDMQLVGAPVHSAFQAFAQRTGRKLRLEIEPGNFLVANAGSLVCSVQDIVSTAPLPADPDASTPSPAASSSTPSSPSSSDALTFIKLDAGMSEIIRPGLYGAQHAVVTVPSGSTRRRERRKYVVVGHCCETGDLLTPAPGDPEKLGPRWMQTTEIGDLVVVEGTGAYCSAMSAKNYNSFPEAPELILVDGRLHVIRTRQTMTQMLANEVALPANL